MNNELEKIRKEAVVAQFRYYPSICMDALRKTTKDLSQESRSKNRFLNPGPLEYKSGVLNTRAALIFWCLIIISS
jgi:hypothetical protein